MNNEHHSTGEQELSTQELEAMRKVVPRSFKEFLVAMVHDDEAAEQLAKDIGLRENSLRA